MSDLPTNGSTPLMDAAIAVHEIFTTYVAAGFSKKEALYLVAQHIKAAQMPGDEAGDQP